jgi:hypothetical protein
MTAGMVHATAGMGHVTNPVTPAMITLRHELPHDLTTKPFPGAIERCTAEDKDTMLRQIRKRRAYPLGACHRCKHGYPQAYLHAPMHIPAAAAAAFVRPFCDPAYLHTCASTFVKANLRAFAPPALLSSLRSGRRRRRRCRRCRRRRRR